ncbi:hypothetical protein [Chitinophaga sp. 212800010-3]|uniref:hypothetical protein n=1 Tax=unclassified Chitinophaga TaxID=2619133 RepID=UPI002DE872A6|nr:SusD-RagB domain-containing protein [Chitinophaga sp. 212800010-3]
MADFKLDRTAFKIRTFEEADAANIFGKEVPYIERLRQAYYLISQAYGFSMANQPRIDKEYFTCRKLNK